MVFFWGGAQMQHAPNPVETGNLFMMCETLDRSAFAELPREYHFRHCRPDEVSLWKGFHFDDPNDETKAFMDGYFERVYEPKSDQFFRSCLFACDASDTPVATAFLWTTYDAFTTLHWLKVSRAHEGRGIGRALLTKLLEDLDPGKLPIFLHTHPASLRAIKLYTDFGFALLDDPTFGTRGNDLQRALPYLQANLPGEACRALRVSSAPPEFIQSLEDEVEPEF
jgi:ribosomal protein S18 acetylase RimI-like enzyme